MGIRRASVTEKTQHGILLVAAFLSVFAWNIAANPAQVLAFSGDGTGAVDDPFIITSCAQLLEISSNLSASYELGDAIDCTSVSFTPIGTNATPFTGTFDGVGYEISNVSIPTSSTDIGIFGVVSDAEITDVRLQDISVGGQDNVGALVGRASYSDISYVFGTDITVSALGDNVGGLVGYLGGASISYSSVENVDVSGAGAIVGGLVGYAVGPSSVQRSYTAGEVTATVTVGGIIGQLGVGPAIANELYTDIVFNASGTNPIGNVAFGATAGSIVSASAPYIGNNTQSPLDTWDFTDSWYVRPGKYPGLRPNTLPQMLCTMPTSTNTSATASCTTEPLLDGNPSWELSYGFDGEDTKTALPSQSGQQFNVTVPDLLEGTTYGIYFRYVDAIGTGTWGKVEATTTGSSDVDADNYSNKDEFLAPNSGDADNDGTLDYQQANVTSFKSGVSGKYVALKTTCTDNFNTQLGAEASATKDAAFDYPAGLIGFVIRGCTVGATVPVEIYHYGTYDAASYVARKANGSVYTTIPNATTTKLTIGGQQVLKLAYQITDGSSLDDDGIADGNIVDPVGIAQSVVGAPNTGLGPL